MRGISFDDVTGNNIAPYQLGLAFNQMGKIDVYGSDACLMQMAEIGYELKDKVPVIVGSEESEPGDGYNYTYLLDGLNRNPDASNEDVGRMRHKNGRWVWVWARGSVVSRTESGEPLIMFGTHLDITSRKHLEQQLKTAKKQAERANRAKSDFLARMPNSRLAAGFA